MPALTHKFQFRRVVLAFVATLLFASVTAAVNKTSDTAATMVPLVNLLLDEEGESPPASNGVRVSGERRVWHRITLDVDGPQLSETSTDNPFTDYRLDVIFENESERFVVPGFFAADGNAANTSATSGKVWRVRFAPNQSGRWRYSYQFFSGEDVAILGGGSPVARVHGLSGSFSVAPSNKTGRDFRAKGRLQYVGERYLKHAGSGDYFLKVGSDAPEGLLGYADFDDTEHQNGTDFRVKTFAAHVGDWQTGDPTWKNDKGKGLIGALNYLASEGQNAFSFLTYSYGGDSRTVWPFISGTERLRYDVSKLAQWEIVFQHADQLGLYLHFKLQEQENDNGSSGLDEGEVGIERRLYYRELIARFGHHLALNWNLGEENTQTTQQQKDMAAYIAATDPYDHNIVIHTFPGSQESVYRPLLGNRSELTGASIQTGYGNVHRDTLQWIEESIAEGKRWIVANDEQGGAQIGVPPDLGFEGYAGQDSNGNDVNVSQYNIRHETLWGNLMAGGAGVEYYFGYRVPCTDLTCEDWRSRDQMWDYNRYAHEFFTTYLPFSEMTNRNDLIGNSNNSDNDGYCFAKVGDIYAVYLNDDERVSLDLTGVGGSYSVAWFNPRTGGALQTGSVSTISGGGERALGNPPDATNDPDEDWVVLIRAQ